jgi:hypothetical protein
MNPSIFIWLIYAFWLILIAYLIVSAIGVKQDTQGHSLQSVGLMLAIIKAHPSPMKNRRSIVSLFPLALACVMGFGTSPARAGVCAAE